MVEQDRIDLIKEFAEIQKNNDYIILTTYCFDPFFFDVYLLNKIQSNNPASEIILLVDAEQYERSYDKFTNDTGRKYHLVPVYMENGVFHPKFFLFLSESEKKLTLYIGSGNITLQGFTRNVELVSKIEYPLTENYSNINKILEILNGLVKKNFINETKVIKIIQEVVTTLSFKTSDIKEDSVYAILHNLEEPILSQLLNEVKDKKFKELLILAPFLSQKPNVLEELVSNIIVEKVILALQKYNHNLKDVSSYRKSLAAKGISFEIKEARFEESERYFHSKILYLNGEQQYLLAGSPNLTIYALLETAVSGNFECAILYTGIKAQEILSSIRLTEVQDLEIILKGAELKQEAQSSLLRIYSVDFDDLGRILNVKTERINDEAVVSISIENTDKRIEKILRLDKGEFSIDIPEGVPNEIIITCGDKTSRRRIFYDKNYFFKRIIRSPISFKEISDRLYSDLSIDISELLILISGLGRSLEIKEKPRERQETVKKDSSKFYLPSKVQSISGVNSLLKTLRDLCNWINFKSQETRELEESFSDEDIEEVKPIEKPKPQYPRYLDEDEERKKLINNIVGKLNQIILLSASKSIDKSREDSLVNSQSILINCFLKMFRKTVDKEIFDNFINILENNLDGVERDNCSKDSVVKLFSHLLTLNYCYNHQDKYRFLRDLFSYSDLVGKNDYYEIKKFVKEFVERYYPEIGFNTDKFVEYYSNLMVFVFSPNDIFEGIVNLANQLVNEDDFELVRFLGEILSAVKDGPWDRPCIWSISDSLLDEIRKIRISVGEQKPEKLTYLDKFLE